MIAPSEGREPPSRPEPFPIIADKDGLSLPFPTGMAVPICTYGRTAPGVKAEIAVCQKIATARAEDGTTVEITFGLAHGYVLVVHRGEAEPVLRYVLSYDTVARMVAELYEREVGPAPVAAGQGE